MAAAFFAGALAAGLEAALAGALATGLAAAFAGALDDVDLLDVAMFMPPGVFAINASLRDFSFLLVAKLLSQSLQFKHHFLIAFLQVAQVAVIVTHDFSLMQ